MREKGATYRHLYEKKASPFYVGAPVSCASGERKRDEGGGTAVIPEDKYAHAHAVIRSSS